MRVYINALVLMFICVSAHASRGFYYSLSGVSSKQEHTTSDYTLTYTVPTTVTLGESATFTIASSTKPVFAFNSNAAILDGYLSTSFNYGRPISILDPSTILTFASYFNFNCTTTCLFHEGDIIDGGAAINSILTEFEDIFPSTINNIKSTLNPNDLTTLLTMFEKTYWQNIADDFLAESINDSAGVISRIDTAIANDPTISPNSTLRYKVLKYIDNRFVAMGNGIEDSIIASVQTNTNNYNININTNNTFFYVTDLLVKDGNNTIMTISRNTATGDIIGTYSSIYQTAAKTATNTEQTSKINTHQQMQDFLQAIAGQSSKGAEVNLGYKIRKQGEAFFLSPQLDFTYFNAKKRQALYTNANGTSAFTFVPTATNTVGFTSDTLNAQYAGSLSTRIGLDLNLNAFLFRVPFSVYGLAGVATTKQAYDNISINNIGIKYGFGGELFLSKRLALFGEYYKINMPNEMVTKTEIVTDYNIAMTEQFKLKTNIDVIRAGLTYYFY
ncbi:MAG: hypothetical protein O3A66_01395 [Proteobacteria bacterium]|nr:hypothetical protein [Pseudomonadota bacterium]